MKPGAELSPLATNTQKDRGEVMPEFMLSTWFIFQDSKVKEHEYKTSTGQQDYERKSVEDKKTHLTAVCRGCSS